MKAEIIVQEDKGVTQKEQKGKRLTKEQREQIAAAGDILQVVVATISRKNYLLQPFLQIFQWVPVEEDILLETDGVHLFYQPERILQMLRNRQLHEVEEALLHILGHGLLGHFELRNQLEDKERADDAMDYEVERLGKKLGWWKEKKDSPYGILPRMVFLEELPEGLESMDAHRIYYGRKSQPELEQYFKEWKSFYSKNDDHFVWERQQKKRYFVELDEDGGEGGEDGDLPFPGINIWQKILQQVFGGNSMDFKELEQAFGEGGKKGNRMGSHHGTDEQCISAAQENHRSYREVLNQFFREREVFSEKADSIDKVLYTYSREMYENVVLVEPEEYSECKKLGTVAVAIDTSGSCSGEVAELFLRETKNIFRDLSGAVSFEKVVLLQCDTEIDFEKVYKSPEELPKGDTFQFYGFGGTDFTPVFQRLDELQKKEDMKIDCLLYLTDGFGTFPDKKPDYPTFFVLTSEGAIVPDWAKKIYLNKKA